MLNDALSRAVDLPVFQHELTIHHGNLTLATFETTGRIVPVHLAVTYSRFFRSDWLVALVTILQTHTSGNELHNCENTFGYVMRSNLSVFLLVTVETMRLSFDGRVLMSR